MQKILQTTMLNFKWFIYTYVIVVPLLSVDGSLVKVKSNKFRQESCDVLLDRAQHFPVTSQIPPSYNGQWTSPRCEIRPGPEFLLRKYKFRRGKFYLHQYYYADPDCSRLLYGVTAQGTIKNLRPSWIVTGGMETKYRLHNVSVIPYTQEIADTFQQQTRRHCRDLKGYIWKPFKTFQIMNFPPYKRIRHSNEKYHDFDCTKVFNLTFHELQLVRVEMRRHIHVPRNNVRIFPFRYRVVHRGIKELFLGDIHTDKKQRQTYRPVSYQSPLKQAKTKGCRVCSELANSNDFYPPELKISKKTFTHLPGEWVSSRCETRQYGQFLTRHLHFLPDGKSWQGTFDFFEDPTCSDASFSLAAKGNYVAGGGSPVISGAKEFSFRVTRLKITPQNIQMTNMLNVYGGKECGVPHSWRVGVQQDVTDFGGCVTLGISLPNIEFDILKMEVTENTVQLFVGQRPTDSRPLRTTERRPTSFQQPLIRCTNDQILENDIEQSNELPPLPKFEKLQSLNSGTQPKKIGVTLMLVTFAIMFL